MGRDKQIIEHIMRYISDIEKASADNNADLEVFKNNKVYKYSVSFCLLQIGELSGKLSEEYRDRTSAEMPWKEIRGLRNIVAHEYGNADDEILWETVSMDIPKLKDFCLKELEKM